MYCRPACCAQVLDDELCYKYSEYGNIHDVFVTRARMFRNVYLHKCAAHSPTLAAFLGMPAVPALHASSLVATSQCLKCFRRGMYTYPTATGMWHNLNAPSCLASRQCGATCDCVHDRKASAVEHMVVDAFLAADPVLRLAEKTEDSREFARLDDTLLRARSADPGTALLPSTCPWLHAAQRGRGGLLAESLSWQAASSLHQAPWTNTLPVLFAHG